MKPQITVSIVEDLDEIRNGMKELLQQSSAFLCLSCYSNAEDAAEELPALQPDIVIMDINLPGMSGINAVQSLKSRCPQIQFLMFTIYENNERVFEALKAGAGGYLLKNTPSEKILEALNEIYEGGAPMSAQIARKVVASFQQVTPAADESIRLTVKEREVLDALAKGFLYKEIADQLQINTSAVRQRIHKIYSKLHVQNSTEALNKIYKR
ncbi:MAG TPA: response regulator transcription factor [Chitinophagaceae bacterium]